MNQISAVIITLNEERNIKRCIYSLLEVADEILVIDSFSKDKTKEICEDLGATVIVMEWQGYSETKNFGHSKAQHEYILSIDADEELSDELIKEINQVKKDGIEGVYSVNRLTNYCGKWIHHCGWYPDVKIRLFPKSKVKWDGAIVHEELILPDNLESNLFVGHLNHYSYTDFTDHRERADKYSFLTAQKMHEAGKKCSFLKPYLSAVIRFIGMYFIQKGFLDGYFGYKISKISGESNFVKYQQLRRLNAGK